MPHGREVVLEPLVFKTEIYEGPLELLLALIAKNKMEILDIKIAPIFEQYMAYVDMMKQMDMEVAGEFITMASELMYIKSRMLLPRKEEEGDPREELVRVLMEYKTAKEAAGWLAEREKDFSGRFAKDTDEIRTDRGVPDAMDIALLTGAMEKLLLRMGERQREAEENRPMESLTPLIARHVVPVSEKIVSVLRFLHRRRRACFDELFDGVSGRSEIVAIFYAVLELLKAGRITLTKEPGDVTGSHVILNFSFEHRKKTEVDANAAG